MSHASSLDPNDPNLLFQNQTTGEIDTYANLTTWETDSETMLAMTDEELEEKQRQQKEYFFDMVRVGEWEVVEDETK